MPTSTRLLAQVLGALLLAVLTAGLATAQQPTPRLWDPADQNPQYQQQKRQAARQQQARRGARTTGLVPGRVLTPVARPTCFEPFDTTATDWSQLTRNDDSSFGPVNLGWNFSLFGTTYNQVYINNNGNITFDSALNSFNAQGLPIDIPMIAAFWADVDTRAPGSGTVWYKVYPDRLVVVWNRVGYFDSHSDKKNTFQLVIKANTAPGFAGDDVLIAYDDMQWTTGDFSNGVNGFDGVPATVGANRGDSVTYIQTGRFNLDSSLPPNVPTVREPGGVHWLDGQCLGYQVRAVTSSNIPPAVAGLPAGNAITLEQGETHTLMLQFSGPEPTQNVSVVAALNGLCNASANVSGNNSTNPALSFSVTGALCNVGTRSVSFTATDNGTPTPAQNTFTVQVTVNPPAVAVGTWTGAVSTVYTDPANWSANTVPTATDDVTIPAAVPRWPVLSTTAAVNGLTVASGASLTVASGGTLRLNGNLTNDGSLNGAGTLQTGGAATQTLAGSTALRLANVTVGTAGLQLSTGLAVARLLTLNGNLAANGNLTLLSDATGTAMIVNNGTAAVTGRAIVQRYLDPSLNPGLGYRHLAAPVTGTTLTDLTTGSFTPRVNPAYNTAANPDAVMPFPNVFYYDQSLVATTGGGAVADFDKGWVSPGSTSETMLPGRGYTVNLAAGQVVDFVGTPGNGAVALTSLTRGAPSAAGWQLLGNPYPSPIDWNLAFSSATGLDNAVHIYKSSGPYAGGYASYVNGVGTNGGSNVIALGQGFFVRTSASGTAGSLSLSNAVRPSSYTDAAVQRTTAETRPLLQLSLSGRGSTDQVAVYFEQGATAGFDPNFDAPKLTAGHPVLLALDNALGVLAINGLPPLTRAPVMVPLMVRVAQAGSYTLRADELLNLPAGTTAQLLDAQTGSITTLTPQTTYPFTADATLTGPRFALVFSPTRLLATSAEQLSAQVLAFPNPTRGQLWLRLPVTARPVVVTMINTLGQQVLKQTLPAASNNTAQSLLLSQLARGVYTLRIALPEGNITRRIVLE